MTSRYGKLTASALLMGAGLLAAGSSASADLINIASDNANSTENLGSFTGSIDYTPGTATLIISLTNTSPALNGGKITGVVFNIDSADAGAFATLSNGTHPFLNTGSESASPFGTLEAGAALGANWTGGGSPNPGIAVGATGIFTFAVTASDSAFLSASSFLFGNDPDSDFNFVVRFKGFANEGSDKVPGMLVPGPSALGLLMVAGMARRRRSA